MKKLTSLVVCSVILSINIFAQTNDSNDAEFKRLSKQLSSEIFKGGKSFTTRHNYVSEKFVTDVVFRGCEIEVKTASRFYDSSVGTKLPISSTETRGKVSADRAPGTSTSLFFNFRDIDPTLFEIRSLKKDDQTRLLFETQNKEDKLELRSGKTSVFTNQFSLGIVESSSAETISIFKSLIELCGGK